MTDTTTTTNEGATVLTTDGGLSLFVRVTNDTNGLPAVSIALGQQEDGTLYRLSPIDAHVLALELQEAADAAMTTPTNACRIKGCKCDQRRA